MPDSTEAGSGVVSYGPTPYVFAENVSTSEGGAGEKTLSVTVRLSFRTSGIISVDYATKDISATAGLDYRRSKGRAIFRPGESVKTIFVPIFGDYLEESDETISLQLYVANGASVSTPNVILTILDDDEPISGLLARPSNPTCVAPDAPTANASIAVEHAYFKLPGFSQPVGLLQAPGDSSQWYVVERAGRIFRFDNSVDADTLETYIDIRGPGGSVVVESGPNEAGLLGMAFHPNYSINGEVFLSYTVAGSDGAPLTSRVSRFTTSDGGLTLDPTSEDILISVNQVKNHHNGGNIAFGGDGFLYIGFGDSGSSMFGQDTTNIHGSILRVDVDGDAPYEIPADNPFALNSKCTGGYGTSSCPEIYAWGLRNPWRWNFDSVTGDLWLADVGANTYEEVNIIERGGNYGWSCREGKHEYDTSGFCPDGLIDPVIEYDHNEGQSITGGYVYRGSAIPELVGRYVFGDYVTGKIFASIYDTQGQLDYEVLLDTTRVISSFAEDENGELLLTHYGGNLRRILPFAGSSTNTIPERLSDTGCVDPVDSSQPSAGLIPYDVNVPFWSDGATKERWYAIPDGTTIDVDSSGDWLFPIGTVLMKHFRLNGELFETRLFMRHTNGNWGGYSYEWDQAGTDAIRVIGGKVKQIQGQPWIYPSESQCMQCHTQAANYSLGIEHSQLNRSYLYQGTGILANQLDTAEIVGMFTEPLVDFSWRLPRLYDLADSETSPPIQDLTEASRSYLHANCSGCHQPMGLTPSNMDLHFQTAFALTNTCNIEPSFGSFGIENAKLITPGISTASIIPTRMNLRDAHGMPPLGSNVVDGNGTALISAWINGLTNCP